LSKASGSVQAHKHCPVCGISISPSKTYCTPEHEELDKNNQRRVKNFRNLTFILLIVTMVVLVAVSLLLQRHG
jgi:predicted nucleic acid-binding Zn ribbon protein